MRMEKFMELHILSLFSIISWFLGCLVVSMVKIQCHFVVIAFKKSALISVILSAVADSSL